MLNRTVLEQVLDRAGDVDRDVLPIEWREGRADIAHSALALSRATEPKAKERVTGALPRNQAAA